MKQLDLIQDHHRGHETAEHSESREQRRDRRVATDAREDIGYNQAAGRVPGLQIANHSHQLCCIGPRAWTYQPAR